MGTARHLDFQAAECASFNIRLETVYDLAMRTVRTESKKGRHAELIIALRPEGT